MKNDKKAKNASTILKEIWKCETEDDLERVSDMLDEFMICGYVFKRDYKNLSKELDDRTSYLVEKGCI